MLRPGDPAPDFTLLDPTATPFHLGALRGMKPVVIFFYPKDNTLVCTREACAFRNRYEEFLAAGAVVVGISDDDAASHMRFSTKWDLPYPLLSDPMGVVRKAYGVTGLFGLLKGRETIVIDREGIIIHIVRDRFNGQAHVDEALDVLNPQRRS
jgi:peroxiredoxin Q/BCP